VPEGGVGLPDGNLVGLEALDHQVVLPELADVVAQRQPVEVLDQAVAHPVVEEVVARRLADLLAQVARQIERCRTGGDDGGLGMGALLKMIAFAALRLRRRRDAVIPGAFLLYLGSVLSTGVWAILAIFGTKACP